jgi:hypothetical protein
MSQCLKLDLVSMMKSKLSMLLLFIVTHGVSAQVFADPYGSGWYGEVQLALEQQENPSRSYRDSDRESDVISNITVGGGYLSKVGNHAEWVASGYLSYRDHNTFDALDNVDVSVGLSGNYQPNLEFDAIWYGLSANTTVLQYRNSTAREGIAFNVDGNLNKRLTTKTTAHAGVRYRDFIFYGKSGDAKGRDAAFNTASSEVYFSIEHELVPAVFFFAEYGYIHGRLTSSVSGMPGSWLEYEAITEDDAFDDCVSGLGCNSRLAYRIVSDARHVDLGVAFSLYDLNIDLSASHFVAQGNSGQRYKDTIVSLGFVWGF